MRPDPSSEDELMEDDDEDEEDFQFPMGKDGIVDLFGDQDLDDIDDDELVPHVKMLVEPLVRDITIRELYESVKSKKTDLQPAYQRPEVWKAANQSKILNFIFQNARPSSLVYNRSHKEDGTEVWTCMDGVQRTTSLVKFIDGKIPFIDPVNKVQFYFTKTSHTPASSSTRRVVLMNGDYRDKFLGKKLTATFYQDLTGEQQRYIFEATQEGLSLKPGEKMAACTGPWSDLCKQLFDKYFDTGNARWDGRFVRDASHRKENFVCTARMVRIVAELVQGREPGHVATEDLYDNPLRLRQSVPPEVVARLEQIFDRITQLSLLPSYELSVYGLGKSKSQGFKPAHVAFLLPLQKAQSGKSTKEVGTVFSRAEITWLPYLLHKMMDTTSDSDLLEIIEMLKTDVRKKFEGEVKTGAKRADYFKNWVAKLDRKTLTGKYDFGSMNPLVVTQRPRTLPIATPIAGPSKTQKKRKNPPPLSQERELARVAPARPNPPASGSTLPNNAFAPDRHTPAPYRPVAGPSNHPLGLTLMPPRSTATISDLRSPATNGNVSYSTADLQAIRRKKLQPPPKTRHPLQCPPGERPVLPSFKKKPKMEWE